MSLPKRLAANGVKKPGMVIREAKRAKLPLPDALAMLEQETGIPQKNIFGCDWGPGIAFCHMRVTAKRVRELIRSGRANGVGWTQLTYQALVKTAQAMGGAWRPKYQCREGFTTLAGLIRQYGRESGHAHYNGSGPAAEAYGREAVALVAKWRRVVHHSH